MMSALDGRGETTLQRWAQRFRGGRLHRSAMSFINRRVEKRLLPILGGPIFFQIMRVACRRDLFGLLRRRPGMTFDELCQELKLDDDPARVLLSGCVSLKLLRHRRGRYFVRGPVIARALDASHTPNVFAFMEWVDQIVAPSMPYLEEALRENRPAGVQAFPGDEPDLYGRLSHDPQRRDIFYDAMNARTRLVNEMFVNVMNLTYTSKVLDVGGGDGEVLEAIARSYPKIQGTLVEIPGVAEQAERRFQNAGLSSRLTAVGGDMFTDDLPSGYDCVLFCHVLANHTRDRIRLLLSKAFDALVPCGRIGVYGAFMDDDFSGPLSSSLLSAYFFCTVSGGRHYCRAETEQWLRDAGFVDVTRHHIMHNHSILIARKPQQ